MRWFNKENSKGETDSGSDVSGNDILADRITINLNQVEITKAEKKLRDTIDEIERLSVKPEFNIFKSIDITQEFILGEVHVKAKSLVLTKLIAEHIRLKLLSQQLALQMKKLT